MTELPFDIQGLNDEQVVEARARFGDNRLVYKPVNGVWEAIKGLVKEPMVILLLVAATIYLVSGDVGDALFLAAAIVLVAAISLYQDSRTRGALKKLRDFTRSHCKVIRNGVVSDIESAALVVGDCLLVEEGSAIAADGVLIYSNDFSVNESILTGESMAVFKDKNSADPVVYRGTSVASGMAVVTITAIGNETKLGKIGESIESIASEMTPLEQQINGFVKKMVVVGVVVFLVVWAINYANSRQLLDSLLKALTLAMSILPEEIPVAFTTFMALGSWRLMQMGIVVKQMKTVETLGSATVICTDKTGTLTENNMRLAAVYALETDQLVRADGDFERSTLEVLRLAMFASEPAPFDPMEIALHQAYTSSGQPDERAAYKMVHEYPLGGVPPFMTHVFATNSGQGVIAAKGAPEAFFALSNITPEQRKQVESVMLSLAADGYRVLGVAEAAFRGNDFPATQEAITFEYKGLVAFYDPPKPEIRSVLDAFDAAGITVKIVTGDNAATTAAIARQIGFRGAEKSISGADLMPQSDADLQQTVAGIHVFSRMFPEAKLRIIKALKANRAIVAMTGDGVNDGPALKAAHIGIAMGKKGTEIAKDAASLILLNDDLSKMVDAIAMGRRIYTNLKKAIQYIISIHIPIVLTVFLPLALGWVYPNIFTPVHIIFLELIMGPTCSIIYENEPMEANTMLQKPRPFSTTFFNWKELTTSVLQGLAITAGTLLMYQIAVRGGAGEAHTRTLVFVTLVAANIFLTLVNRSFYYSVLTTLRYKNNLVGGIIGLTVLLTAGLLYLAPLARFFHFEPLALPELGLSVLLGFCAVMWFEIVKWRHRQHAVDTP